MLSKGLLFLVFFLTLTTSWVAASKLVENLSQNGQQNQTASTNSLQKVLSPTPSDIQNNPNNTTPISSAPKSKTLISNTPTLAPTATGCIVTLFGNQYDVTSLRQAHSGGDVFKCGADMTADYQSRHGTNVSIMQRYLIIGGSSTIQPSSVSNTNQTAAPVRRNNNDD